MKKIFQTTLKKKELNFMPHIVVKLYPGRSEEVKKKLADEITKTVVKNAGTSEDAVSVDIIEVEKDKWQKEVYEPEIAARMDKLYKKPNC